MYGMGTIRIVGAGLLAGILAFAGSQAPGQAVEPPKMIINSIGMKLALIPAGEFLMGSPDSDQDALPFEQPR